MPVPVLALVLALVLVLVQLQEVQLPPLSAKARRCAPTPFPGHNRSRGSQRSAVMPIHQCFHNRIIFTGKGASVPLFSITAVVSECV